MYIMPSSSNQDNLGILSILVKDKKLTPDDLEQAKMAFVGKGVDEIDWLISQKKITSEDLVMAKSKFYNVQFIKLADQAVSSVALGLVEKSLAKRLLAMPFEYSSETRELSVAMVNPIDLSAIEFLEKKSGVRVKPFLVLPDDLNTAIETRYDQG